MSHCNVKDLGLQGFYRRHFATGTFAISGLVMRITH